MQLEVFEILIEETAWNTMLLRSQLILKLIAQSINSIISFLYFIKDFNSKDKQYVQNTSLSTMHRAES